MSQVISHRERIFVRAVTLSTKLRKEKVTQSVLREAINDANDEEKATTIPIAKMSAALNTKKHCLPKDSNQRFFVPYMFGTVVATKLINSNLIERLGLLIFSTERDGYRRSMVETLRDSHVAMWYMDKTNEVLLEVSKKICEHFVNVVQNNGTMRYHVLRRSTIDAFRTLADRRRVPSVVTYLKYEAGKKNGCPRHQDVDAVFFTALLYLKDSALGRLAINRNILPELFEPGDVVYMDPRVEHWVEEVAREEDRQVVVFTF